MTTGFGPRRARSRRWRALVLVTGVSALVALGASPAGAGGWAVSTLDPIRTPLAPGSTAVGFTIRQHGVRPVNPDGDVGIEMRDPAGGSRFFPADAHGSPGHFVARVRFDAAGTYRWAVHQGWFGEQDLGPVQVAAGGATTVAARGALDAPTAAAAGYRWPIALRVLVPLAGAALGILAIALGVRDRRRHAGASVE